MAERWRNQTCLASFVLSLMLAPCARAEFSRDYQQWAVLNLDLVDPVVEGLRFSLNVESRSLNQPRRAASATPTGEEEQNPNTVVMLRPFVGYQIAAWFTVWAGYAYQPILYRTDVREDVHEHRAFEQLSGNGRFGRLELSYRTRLEQRFRTSGDNEMVSQGEGQWAHRFRQQVRAAYTLSQGAPWQLIAYDELFIHLTDTRYPSRAGLDQNRLFAGVGCQATQNVRLEAGYMNQLVRRYTDRHQNNHVLWISLNFRFDLAHGADAARAEPDSR